MVDGVEQMGLAQTGLAVDKQRVIALAGIVCHMEGGVIGKLVGGAHHKVVKGKLLTAHKHILIAPVPLALIGIGVRLGQHQYLQIGGKEVKEYLFQRREIPGDDDVPFKRGGHAEDDLVLYQVNGLCIAKPCADRSGRQLPLQKLNNADPNIGSRIHIRKKPPIICPKTDRKMSLSKGSLTGQDRPYLSDGIIP